MSMSGMSGSGIDDDRMLSTGSNDDMLLTTLADSGGRLVNYIQSTMF